MTLGPADFLAADPSALVLRWLQEEDDHALRTLWSAADRTRARYVGDQVHLRGLLEVSNHCVRRCAYCGIRAPRAELTRYRMSLGEALACARDAARLGVDTIVIQAGEDDSLDRDQVSAMVRGIKSETGLAVTLSLGERSEDDFAAWRQAGADRYLLRFETSDKRLYDEIHPPRPGRAHSRFDLLKRLRAIGYEIGSGVMVGIPGQSWESLARDVVLFWELGLDMIGVGPFLPHPATPLGHRSKPADADQVPATGVLACKVVALARLLCPRANIPATTALGTLDREHGRRLGLRRGANVVMPNVTPAPYRALYDIYPGKSARGETADEGRQGLEALLAELDRPRRRGTSADRPPAG